MPFQIVTPYIPLCYSAQSNRKLLSQVNQNLIQHLLLQLDWLTHKQNSLWKTITSETSFCYAKTPIISCKCPHGMWHWCDFQFLKVTRCSQYVVKFPKPHRAERGTVDISTALS